MRPEKAKKILETIKDPKQRKTVEGILYGIIVKNVRCMSKACKGRIVAHIYNDGSIKATTEKNKRGELLMFLRAFRHRLDGYLGFECWCGNDSRLCEAEKGVVGRTVDKAGLEKVHDRLQRKPANYVEKNGKILIDKFLIEKI